MLRDKVHDSDFEKKLKELFPHLLKDTNSYMIDVPQRETGMKYVLVMFPYPSADRLHLGHCYNYAPIDTYVRFKRMQGESIFFPFGFDAFGLPAENYAIKTGIHPKISTHQNMEIMRTQIKEMNINFDFDDLETCSPHYYVSTQKLFQMLFKSGLVYKKESEVNYCNECKTVLANEQCQNNRCDRCNSVVNNKVTNQWFVAISKYKDRLLRNLDNMSDWPEKTIKMQRNWINNLRDWCISRQRYWGAPIPIVYDPSGNPHLIPDKHLPWLLPEDVDFIPDGKSPLERSKELKERVESIFGSGWTPDYDTMDTFVCSSFYYTKYAERNNSVSMPVDLYVGGSEHACMHLIYARFINMFLFDNGLSPTEEPFTKVVHQGIITRNGHRMSKSKGNAVDAESFIKQYGADALRLHLMFMGPFDCGGDWSDVAINGQVKLIKHIKVLLESPSDYDADKECSVLEQNVSKYVDAFKFHLAISEFMKFYNSVKKTGINKNSKQRLRKLFSPFSPTLT